MEGAFAVVVIVVSVVAVAAALAALATSRGAYDRIGRGGLSVEDDAAPDRDAEEVRQLIEAGNARRVARGEPPLDVDAEVRRRLAE
jgi:hypothetical protein